MPPARGRGQLAAACLAHLGTATTAVSRAPSAISSSIGSGSPEDVGAVIDDGSAGAPGIWPGVPALLPPLACGGDGNQSGTACPGRERCVDCRDEVGVILLPVCVHAAQRGLELGAGELAGRNPPVGLIGVEHLRVENARPGATPGPARSIPAVNTAESATRSLRIGVQASATEAGARSARASGAASGGQSVVRAARGRKSLRCEDESSSNRAARPRRGRRMSGPCGASRRTI